MPILCTCLAMPITLKHVQHVRYKFTNKWMSAHQNSENQIRMYVGRDKDPAPKIYSGRRKTLFRLSKMCFKKSKYNYII